MSATFADSTHGQVRLETIGSDRIAVASYKDGKLRGAEIAHTLESSWAGDWVRERRAVDHPEFAAWSQQLERMREVAAAGASDPSDVIRATRGFPFSAARKECLLLWAGDSPNRCAALLDRYRQLDLGKAAAVEVTAAALREPHDDERLAGWIDAMAEENHRDAALLVVAADGAGAATAQATLRRLDSFSSSARRDLFDATAFRLLGDPGSSWLLVDAVDELSSTDEAPALLALLRTPHATAELGFRVLTALDDFRSTDRGELLFACARIVGGDGRAADALAGALDDVRSSERLAIARRLFALPADAELVAAMLRVVDDLPSRDRLWLVDAAIAQPHWNSAIARAADNAVDKVTSRQRDRLRAAIAERDQASGR